MPRIYKPDPRGKKYLKYDANIIQQAVNEYSAGGSSLKTISEKYKIHKSVLYRHCTKNMKSQGGQTVLSKETEEEFIKYINICADWGYPLEAYDLRMLVKVYLDKLGITEKRFKNNMPGPDFVSNFMKRHKDVISQRISQNIKRNRAAVSPEIINKYFEELERSLKDVSMSNIINYDETNLSDDPGRKKIITKRGVKYPERIMNHSKSAVSLMIACTAEGELLPPYVVYKAQHLYDTWTIKGPKGTRYNRSQSGWFDGSIFEDWIKSLIIPYFQGKPGKKILIGDNLSSHLSLDLIKLCHKENISFVFLPANSTHITQPLDVAFFRPMKIAWRNILFQWKKTDGRKHATIPKGCFPHLLSMLFDALKDNSKDNILAGFKKAGINPLDPTQVLKRLPGCGEVSHHGQTIDESIITILKEMRYGSINVVEPKRKRKIDVEPGKSVSLGESYVETEIENQDPKNKKMRMKVQLVNKKDSDDNKQKEPKIKKGKGIGKKSKKLLNPKVLDEAKSVAVNSLNLEAGPSNMQNLVEADLNYLDLKNVPIIFDDNIVINHVELMKTKVQLANNKESVDNEQKEPRTKKGKGVGKKSKPLPNPSASVEAKSMVANFSKDYAEAGPSHMQSPVEVELKYLDLENVPIIFGDDIAVDHFETIDNLNVSNAITSSNGIKNNNKIEVISDIPIINSKLEKKISFDNSKMKLIKPDTKLNISQNFSTVKRYTNKKERTYYKNDEEILSDLMSDIE